jgi:hypothetical protein
MSDTVIRNRLLILFVLLPERIEHWTYNPAAQLCSEVETLISQKGTAHGLKSYKTLKGVGWNVLVGVDHSLGACWCHTKVMAHNTDYQCHF